MDRALWTDGSSYRIGLEQAIEVIREKGARRVGLQVPEGLKRAAPDVARMIEERSGAAVIISGDPSYGACDLDLNLCEEVDILLHLGHAQIGADRSNVIFIEVEMRADLEDAARKAAGLLNERTVGLTTTAQHIHNLSAAINALKEIGITGIAGAPCGRTRYPGQVLGCCYAAARSLDVKEYLFLGTGLFHPLGVALSTKRRVVAADPLTGEVREIDPEPMLRRRFYAIERAKGARRIAVLVSKKEGQRRMELGERMKALGESRGREMYMIYLDNIEPDRLVNLGLDAAVCTACPRIALDDASRFSVPVLTPPELEIALGERRWEDYVFDEIE